MPNQFDIITGTFRPKRTDDLKPQVLPYVGTTGQWQALWIIEDGPYKDQWALAPYEWEPMPKGLYFVPECDVAIHADDEKVMSIARQFIDQHADLLRKLDD